MEPYASYWSNSTDPQVLARTAPNTLLAWNIEQAELEHVPEHWLKFSAPHPMYNYLLGFLYVIFTFFSVIGNGLVIYIFITSRNLRTPSNMLVVNLAICDFIMMAKTPIMIYNSMHLGFALGNWGCQIYGVMGSLSGIGASTTNACIAYDRYKTISDPLNGKLTKGKALFMILLVYAYVMPWTVLPAMRMWSRFVPEGYLTTCTFDYFSETDETRLFVTCIFICSWVIPMSLIVYFYSQIVSHVVNHEKSLRDQAKKMNVESLRSNQAQQNQTAEIRIAKAAITIVCMFVISWTPYGIMAVVGVWGNKDWITPGVSMLPACTCKIMACVDPYVYAISHPRYRLELQRRMPWLSGCIREALPGGDTNSQATETSGATPS